VKGSTSLTVVHHMDIGARQNLQAKATAQYAKRSSCCNSLLPAVLVFDKDMTAAMTEMKVELQLTGDGGLFHV